MPVSHPVVVGVDGSSAALAAVRWATRLCTARGLPLVLVTAVSAPAFADVDNGAASALDRILSDGVDAARAVAADVSVSTETHHGTPAGVLVERSTEAAMIVVGTRGLGEFTGGLSASVSTAVATHASCAVTVVPLDTPPSEGAEHAVVVGVDGTDNSVPAVRWAFEIASSRGASLIAVHAWSDIDVPGGRGRSAEDEEAVLAETMAGWSQDYPDVEVQRVVVQDRPVRELVARSAEADLVVVGRRGRGGFTSLLLGSTSRAVMHSVDVPVTVVPSPA
ncbi:MULTISPECIES: universal stress protein [Nocardiaceae]|uniref:Nucleotide-binding universal stress UspA family protein n=1 Tax=Rhodococcoides corynebacterioides TaxID=53972 RepID=A0ABS2KU15_9NOCA|nr:MULTISPECIES: universal stress protein [Rhodococcus]MBM7415362.1 nucleotide-binding universal stress UspA family protein [Rhodococcus corynebacterioides]MBP1117824.1 nucleotide-binding universal stress UspA family protein [Rhodococcus sp. PvP016]